MIEKQSPRAGLVWEGRMQDLVHCKAPDPRVTCSGHWPKGQHHSLDVQGAPGSDPHPLPWVHEWPLATLPCAGSLQGWPQPHISWPWVPLGYVALHTLTWFVGRMGEELLFQYPWDNVRVRLHPTSAMTAWQIWNFVPCPEVWGCPGYMAAAVTSKCTRWRKVTLIQSCLHFWLRTTLRLSIPRIILRWGWLTEVPQERVACKNTVQKRLQWYQP